METARENSRLTLKLYKVKLLKKVPERYLVLGKYVFIPVSRQQPRRK